MYFMVMSVGYWIVCGYLNADGHDAEFRRHENVFIYKVMSSSEFLKVSELK